MRRHRNPRPKVNERPSHDNRRAALPAPTDDSLDGLLDTLRDNLRRADAFVSTAERQIEENWHDDESDESDVEDEFDTVLRHRMRIEYLVGWQAGRPRRAVHDAADRQAAAAAAEERMSSARVLVCFTGLPPQEIRLPSDPGLRGHLGGLRDLIGGPVENVALSGGVFLWHSVGALCPGPGLPLNRRVPRDPQLPPEFEKAKPARLAALMAANAHHEVHGEFVLARGNAQAGLVDLTDDDVERWTRWFEVDARMRGEK